LGVALPTVYDSSRRHPAVIGTVRNLASYRGLLRLLVERDLTVRYKRSFLGVWWTLLNPMLTMGVMWVVFSQLFHLQGGQVPYLVYLFSGLVVFTFFQQAVMAVGSSLTASSGLLSKVYVPAEVFSLAAALAVTVNFCISAAVLLVIQLAAGPGVHLSLLLAPFSLICLLGFATGLGLLVATLAVRFNDALDLTAVLITLVGYLTPTFYPENIVPARFQPLLHFNPLYSHLRVFRAIFFAQEFPPAWTIAVTAGSAVVMLLIGATVFTRSWRSIAVML
jgi:ABC-type polysaccharide/polyol phosphate export permease